MEKKTVVSGNIPIIQFLPRSCNNGVCVAHVTHQSIPVRFPVSNVMWNAISSYSQDEKESCSIFTICFGPVPGVLSIRCRCPSELKKIRPARRSEASSLKATCGLSRRRAVSELVVLGAVALSMPAQAAMLEPDITR